jgi:hypothetical protein
MMKAPIDVGSLLLGSFFLIFRGQSFLLRLFGGSLFDPLLPLVHHPQHRLKKQEMQDQQIIEQANNEIKQRDLQIAQLNKELDDTKRQIELKGYALEREFTLEEFKHKNELEKMILQHKLDGSLTDKDLMEMANEQEKQKMELQREGMKLDGEEMKSQAEAIKAENEVMVSEAKTKQSLAKLNETNAKTVNTIIKEKK